MHHYNTHGTCSKSIAFAVQDGVITHCAFEDGCQGNTQGVACLAVGRRVEDVISLLRGIQCQNGTSCPDQLARALQGHLASSAPVASTAVSPPATPPANP